jgi:hypothetical protein
VYADNDGNTAMAEMATATAMAVAIMLLLPPMATMSMRTTAAIQGHRLYDGNLTTMMGQRQCMSMMTAMTALMAMLAMVETAMVTLKAAAMGMMPPPLLMATMLMKMMAEI